MSSSRTCWTMCIVKACSPRASIGEIERDEDHQAAGEPRRQAPAGRRRAGRRGPATAAPAAHVDARRARATRRIGPGSSVQWGSAATARATRADCGTRSRASAAGTFAPRALGRGVPSPASRQARARAAPPALRAGAAGLPGLRRAARRPARGAVRGLPRARCRGCASRCCPRCAPAGAPRRAAAPRRRARPRAWAPLAHAGPAAALVHALKHRGALRRGRRDGGAQIARATRRRRPAGPPAPALVPRARAGRARRRRARASTTPRGWPARSAARTGLAVCPMPAPGAAAPAQVGASRAAAPGGRPGPPWRSRGRLPPVRGRARRRRPDDRARPWRACAAALRAAGARRSLAITYARALSVPSGRGVPSATSASRREELHADRGQGSQRPRHRRASGARRAALQPQ